MKLSAGILAGGKSTRMGQNKALLQLNNIRFIDKIAGELSGFSQVLISAAEKGVYEDTGIQIVYDEHRDIGPIEGIYQILSNATEEYVFICGADMPFIRHELVEYMAEFISSDYDCFCLTDNEHIHPLCAIYSKRMLGVIKALIDSGQYRLMKVLDSVRTKYIKLELSCFDKKLVKNINTKSEYAKLVCPVIFCVSAVKNSGKTGLIIKLINEFISENYNVGVIKHDGHEYVMDHVGTDTYRYSNAGAKKSIIFSNTQYSMNCKGSPSIEDMIKLCKEMDIIIIEGMKASDYPKIEVVRKVISTECVCNQETLICVATDVITESEVRCPVYGLDDIKGIYSCVKAYFGLD